MTYRRRGLILVAGLAVFAAACGNDSDVDDVAAPANRDEEAAVEETAVVDAGEENVRAVPEEYDTIQEAVDDAQAGDLVLVSPGVYNEAVLVTTPDIVIRGLDRNEVVLDGEFERTNAIDVEGADGVVIENMTARNYTGNGFYWTGVERYRGSYLTAHNIGVYGIYAFDSTTGQIERSYASGTADAGFYIGQCNPCDAVIRDVVAEHNGLGYSGSNSGGNLLIVDSVFRNNRAGIVPNTLESQENPPQRATTIVGNLVHDNSNGDTAATEDARLATGNGILVFGGVDNMIERNRVVDHDVAGIALVPGFGENVWPVEGNVVRDNVVARSAVADLAAFDEPGAGNCFADNTFATAGPANLETLLPCDGEGRGDRSEGALDLGELARLEDKPPSGDYRQQPTPGPQGAMPDAASAPWEPAGPPPEIDLAAIAVPAEP
jgi:hypothetical protein